MKQKLLNSIRLRALMLVAVMCAAFAGQAWADTYTFNSSIPTTGWTTSGGSQSINSKSWTYSSCTYIGAQASRIQIGSKNNPQTTAWTIQTAVSNFGANKRITAIAITAYTTATSATYDISAGGSSVKSGSLTTSSATYTASGLNVTSGNIVITLTGSSTSKAMYLSDISVTYEDNGGGGGSTVDAPSFSPEAGAVTAGTTVELSSKTDGAAIYYTLTTDGSDPAAPTSSSTPYTDPISITTATKIKAIAIKDEDASSITSASYTINVASPVFNLDSNGSYLSGTGVTLTSTGNTIYYNMTTNGSDPEAPTSTSTEYAGPISLSSGTVKIKAIAYDAYGNASSVVSRTINGVNPTTLPFNWAGGGKATLTALTGVVGSGLGSDYGDSHNPYMVKFDNDNDYIEVFTNAQPLKVSVGVKMIGGNSTSKIKVQESTNGVEFTDVQELDISGSQNDVVELETTANFAATTRVIKLLFVKGANVGVGPISITKYTVGPDIDVADSDVELAGDATSGEIEYSIINPDGVSSLSAESEDDWISEITVTASKVTFTTTANDGAERVGHITLSYPNAENKVVTVTQAEKVVTLTYNLVSSITSGKHYIISSGNQAMGAQRDNNRGSVEVTVDAGNISFLSNASVAELIIYGPDADGYYTIYDGTGYLYAASSSANNLKTQAGIDNNARWEITFDGDKVASIVAQGSNSRNVMQYNSGSTIFSCYGSASQSDVYLYEKDGEATPTESVTVGAAGYTTYTTVNPVSFPTGVTAYIATAVNPSTIHLEEVLDAPARTPLVIEAEAGSHELDRGYEGLYIDVVKSTPNILQSSNGSVKGDGSYIYALGVGKSGVNKGVVGFYLVNKDQTIPAGKAYLNTAGGLSVKEFLTFDFDDLPTAVSEVKNEGVNSEKSIFNLAGQKMSKLQKGVNIVNGKKVLVK